MADQVVGRVKVRVMPDTSDFAEDTRKKLKGQATQIPHLKVKVVPDFTGFYKELVEEIQAIQTKVKTTKSLHIEVPVRVSKVWRKQLNETIREMQDHVADKGVVINTDALATQVRAELDKSSAMQMNQELNAYIKSISPKRVIVRAELDKSRAAILEASLDTLARDRRMKVTPFLDSKSAMAGIATMAARLSGLRLAAGLFDHFKEFFTNIDKAVPLISSITLAIMGLSGIALEATASLVLMSRSLAQMGAAALYLPGILGGVVVGVGALVAVMMDFNERLPEVEKKLKAMQDAMSNAFWAKAEAPIRRLINTLLPQFQAGIVQTSAVLGTLMSNLANGLRIELTTKGADGLSPLQRMFEGLNKSIEIMAGHMGSVATLIRVFGEVGAEQLPRLAAWVGDLIDQFARWAEINQANGNLRQWAEDGIRQIQGLWSAMVETVRFFGLIADAAEQAGKSPFWFEEFANKLRGLNKVMATEEFQTRLSDLFRASEAMFDNFAAVAGKSWSSFWGSFSQTLITTMPLAGEALGNLTDGFLRMLGSAEVQNGLVSMMQDITLAAINLQPAFDALAPKIGAIMELIGAMANSFAQVFASLLTHAAPLAEALATTLTPVVEKLGPMISSMIEDLAPVFTAIGDGVIALKEPILELIGEFQKLWEFVSPVLIPVLQFLANILMGAIKGAVDGVVLVFKGLNQAIEGVVKVFQGDFSGLKDIVVGIVTAIGGAIWTWLNVTLIGFFRGGLAKIATAWTGGLTGLKNAATGAWNGILNFTKGIFTGLLNVIKGGVWGWLEAFVQGGSKIKGFLGGVWEAIKAGATSMGAAVLSAIKTKFTAAVDFVKGVPGKLVNVLRTGITQLTAIGGQLMQGLKDGLVAKFQEVKDAMFGWAGDLIGGVKGIFGIHSPSRVMKEIGNQVMAGLRIGLSSQFQSVKNDVNRMATELPEKFGDAARRAVEKYTARFNELADRHQELSDRIKQIQDEYVRRAMETAEKVRGHMLELGDIFTMGSDSQPATFEQLKSGMAEAIRDATKWKQTIEKLYALDLNDSMMQQLLEAGPTKAQALADEIIKSGKKGVQELNKQQEQLDAIAKSTYQKVLVEEWNAGAAAAKGLVKGLQSEMKTVEKEMARIAKAIVKIVKKELKIKSPSRVMRQMGSYTGQGFALGIEDEHKRAEKAIKRLASVRPSFISSNAAATSAGAGVVSNRVINYYAAANTPSFSAEEGLFAAINRARSNF